MRVAALVALAGLVALVVALLTGSTLPAVLVIALAALGIVLLLRDWRAEQRHPASPDPPTTNHAVASAPAAAPLSPDRFAPDISGVQGGPSSDARAD
ncbi:MAG: hypothetical protein KDB72_03740 [Mycobacterium sp.]|nr:hypothetical protein [Mycobacterium sp.]